ncbi:hypothetical protein vseg_014897 [Gypsophila vaccaria]
MTRTIAAEAVKITDDEQAFVEKLKERLKTEDETGFITRTGILNYSKRLVRYNEIHFWHGYSPYSYVDIPVGSGIRVAQYGVRPEGVKFGLVFVDDGLDTATARRFVVAVDTPARKIYAESGPNGPVDWNTVEAKLDMAGESTEFEDPVLGGKVIAIMVDDFSITRFYN